MTDAARVRMEAWMYAACPHPTTLVIPLHKYECPDCLLAFAAAQYKAGYEAAEQAAMPND